MIFTKIRFRLEIIFRSIGKNYYLILVGLFLGIISALILPRAQKWWQFSTYNPDRIGLVGRYRPDKLPQEVSSLLSYGLVETLPNGKIENSPLTKSWDIQENGLLYRFFLNLDQRWHDGSRFQAKDINYQIPNIQTTPIGSDQVNFTPKEIFTPLPYLLSEPLLKKGLVGLGPYKAKKINVSQGLVKNLLLAPLEKQNKHLSISFYPTENDLITAFKLGEIDEARGISDTKPFQNFKNVQLIPQIESNKQYSAIFFNTRKEPFSDKRFRQTLAYTTPKENKENRCLGPISPQSWAYNPTIKPYEEDVNRAKLLSQEIEVDWKDKEIRLEVSSLELLETAEKIAQSWRENLGLAVQVTLTNSLLDRENFDALLAYGSVHPDPDQYAFWHSTQKEGNLTGINNPRLDELLEEGRQTLDSVRRKEIYQDFQRFLSEESPAIFLSFPTTYTINRK